MLLQSVRKTWRNCDRRAMCNATRGIEAMRGVICHRGVSDSSDGAHPLRRSHSARTVMFFADEGEGLGKDADISYQSTPVAGSGPYKTIRLGTHLWTFTDIQCLQRHGREGMGSILWYNLSSSSHNMSLCTIPSDVAAPQEQKFAFLGVVGCRPLIYWANVCQHPRPNEQLEVGQSR